MPFQTDSSIGQNGGTLDAILDPAILVDACGRIQQINRAAVAWLHELEFRLIGESAHRLFHNPAQQSRDCALCQAVKNNSPCHNHQLQNGASKHLMISSSPLDPANPQLGSLQIIRDVTELHRWQQGLKQKAERFELGLSCANDALWDYDFRTADAYLSPHFRYRFKIDEVALSELSFDWLSRVHEEDREQAKAIVRDCLKDRTEKFRTEIRFRDRNDQTIWMLIRGRIVRDETDREPIRLIAVLTDITRQKVLDSALRQSEQRFRGVFDSAGHGMAIVSPDGVIRKGNQALCTIFGYRKSKIHQVEYEELVYSSDLSKQQGVFRQLLSAQKNSYCGEHRFKHLSGDEIHAILAITLVRDRLNNPIHFIVQLMDITDYKVNLERLKKREFEFSKAQSVARIGCWSYQLATNVIELDDMGKTLVGEENLEYFKDFNTTIEHVHPIDKSRLISSIENAIDKEKPIEEEFRVLFPHCDPMFFQLRGELLFDDEGKPSHIDGIFQDVTELRKNKAKLDKHHDDMANAESIAHFGIWEWTVVPDELNCSAALLELLGLDVDGKPKLLQELVNLIHPDDIGLIMNALDAALVGTDKLDALCRVYRTDNTLLYTRVVGSVLRDEFGAPVLVSGILQDVTQQSLELLERERMQNQLRQAQRMESLGQLTGGIAHDFSNILGSMLGYVHMARDRLMIADGSEIEEYLREIDTAGRRARDLISQMMLFSKGGSVASKPMVLGPLVDKVLKMVRPMLSDNIDLNSVIESTLPVVMMDSIQLHQLLMNLCLNARDALSPDQSGTIQVKVYSESIEQLSCCSCHQQIDGEYLVISVADNGSGIDPQSFEKIFDPFFSTKPSGEGTGMGLSVVHGIVHEHNGHVEVLSTVGQGTELKLYFPAVAMEMSLGSAPMQSSPVAKEEGRIMVVEDDDTLLRCLSGFLMSRGFDVWRFHDPVEALNVYRQDPSRIDLVITDMNMPGMRGDRLAQELLAIRRELPVILTTGFVHHMDADKARELGILGFLTKPVDPEELTKLIGELWIPDKTAQQV